LAKFATHFSATNSPVARDMARGFIESGSQYPDLVAKATEMYERASVEAERQARENRQQAREIAQRGIEYYQQALSFASQLRSTEVSSSVRPYSAKQEAIKYARRAIDSLKTAINIDPESRRRHGNGPERPPERFAPVACHADPIGFRSSEEPLRRGADH
jgi:hypothetical protein